MPTTSEIICPKCGAPATNSNGSWGFSKPYCSVCGWNLERAKEGEQRNLKQGLVVLLCCGLFLGIVGYFFAAKSAGSSVFFVVVMIAVVLAVLAFISWRRLKGVGLSQPKEDFPDAFGRVAPAPIPSGTWIMYERLLTTNKPRRTSLKTTTGVTLAIFLCVVGFFFWGFGIGHRPNLHEPNTTYAVTYWGFVVVFAGIWAIAGGAIIRSAFRDRRLLANGDVAIAVIVGQQTVNGRRQKISRIEYQFKDAAGREYTGKSNDVTRELYEDMQTIVFYNRDDPAENVPIVGATVNLVDF